MKPNIKYIILIILSLFVYSCGPKPLISPKPVVIPVKVDAGNDLFSEAEKMFQAKSYEQALAGYYEYLSRYPDRPSAAAALIKIGAIYMALGKYDESRNCYHRLIAEYPKSSFVPDAWYQILLTLYKETNYEEVIKQSAFVLKNLISRDSIFKIYTLVGDSHMAKGTPSDAFKSYLTAYNESEANEKKSMAEKLKAAVLQMGQADMLVILNQLEDGLPKSYIMLQLGLSYTKEEKYEDALTVLSAFIKRFPEHENIEQAINLINELNKKSLYNRYAIGVILPLTGPYQIYGERALKGIELALTRFNFRNIQTPIKISIKDTGSDSSKALGAVRELLEEDVAAIIGPIITAESVAIEAQKFGIPIVTLTQKENITNIGDNVFRNFLTPKMQVKALVSYAIEELGLNSFAILHPDENYGKTFMNLFWDEVIAYGGKVVGLESYNSSQTDFADSIKKLVGLYYDLPEDLKTTDMPLKEEKSTNIIHSNENNDINDSIKENMDEEKPQAIVDFDAVFIPDAPKKAGLVIPQLAFYDVKDIFLLGTNLWHSESLIQMARQYVQGAVLPDGFFANSSSKIVKDFVSAFEETYRETPGFIEAVTYDTAMILFQMISRPDIRFRSTLKEELMKIREFQGVTGLTSFDNSGDVKKKLYLLCIKGEKFLEIESW